MQLHKVMCKDMCMCVQLCPTLCDPLGCSCSGSSVHGISQARILEWVAISYSRGSSWPRNWTCLCCVSCIGRQILYSCTTWGSIQFSHSVVSDSLQPHGLQQARLPCPSWSLLKLMSIESVMPSNHLILCHFLLLLPSIFSSIRVFSNKSVFHIRWLKYWSFSISPSNEYSGLIFFTMDQFDFLAVQGTLKSLLQHHSSKPSVLWHSAFFIVQLSHAYMTTGKTIALTIQTFVTKVMSLLFNTLSRFVIAFLPRSKCLNFMTAVTICSDFWAPQNKVSHCFIVSPFICHEVIGLVLWS